MSWELKITMQDCPGCGICADVCPEEAIKMTREMSYPESILDKCNGCLICVKECPFDALEVKELQVQ